MKRIISPRAYPAERRNYQRSGRFPRNYRWGHFYSTTVLRNFCPAQFTRNLPQLIKLSRDKANKQARASQDFNRVLMCCIIICCAAKINQLANRYSPMDSKCLETVYDSDLIRFNNRNEGSIELHLSSRFVAIAVSTHGDKRVKFSVGPVIFSNLSLSFGSTFIRKSSLPFPREAKCKIFNSPSRHAKRKITEHFHHPEVHEYFTSRNTLSFSLKIHVLIYLSEPRTRNRSLNSALLRPAVV